MPLLDLIEALTETLMEALMLCPSPFEALWNPKDALKDLFKIGLVLGCSLLNSSFVTGLGPNLVKSGCQM